MVNTTKYEKVNVLLSAEVVRSFKASRNPELKVRETNQRTYRICKNIIAIKTSVTQEILATFGQYSITNRKYHPVLCC